MLAQDPELDAAVRYRRRARRRRRRPLPSRRRRCSAATTDLATASALLRETDVAC